MNQRLTDIRRAQLDQLLSGNAHMAGGGLLKAAVKAAEVAKPAVKAVQEVLPLAEREANLAKFMEGSVAPKLYHGTVVRPDSDNVKGMGDIREFDRQFTTKFRKPSLDTLGNWFSDNPGKGGAEMYSGAHEGSAIYPVHVSMKNPHKTTFELMQRRARLLANGEDDGRQIGQAEVDAYRKWLKSMGKDGVVVQDNPGAPNGSTEFQNQSAYITLEPTQIKSAIGNRGTYDLTDPDITKANGGLIHLAGGGLLKSVVKAAKPAAKAAEAASQLGLGIKKGLGWAGSKTPDTSKLAKNAKKFIYHSDVAPNVNELHHGIEPQQGGPWVREVAHGAVDNVDEFLENTTPLAWFSDDPTWVKMKVSRHLNKPLSELTEDDIRKYGHLAIINKKDPSLENIWRVGEEGLSNGEYSKVQTLKGESIPAHQTDLYQNDYQGNKEPFGVERDEWVSTQPVEPFVQLTGDDLIDFLKKSGNFKAGGEVHLSGGGDPRKRGLFPKMSMQAIVNSPGFDPEVPSDLSRAYARRIAEKEAYERSMADQKLTPAQRAIAGAEASGMLGSAMFEGVQQLPKLMDGEDAYMKAVGERMYQPRFQPEKAAEYAGNVGDFLEKLETEYKMPQLLPELLPFAGAAEASKQQAKKAVKQGALTAASRMDAGPTAGSMAAQRGVIKMPGGNFLTGRVEKDVAPLKTRTIAGETPAQRIPRHEELLKDPSLNQDQLDRVKYHLEETKKEAALDKWIDSNLSNYIKKQLGTPDDPVRALAEQGITHKASLLDEYPHDQEALMRQRKAAGFPEEGMAQSPLAKAWERASDESIPSHRAGDIQEMPEKFTKHDEAERKMIAAREELDNKFLNHIEKEIGLNDKEAASLARGMTYAEKARLVGDQDFLQANVEYLATHDPMMSSYIALGRENPWIAKVAPETQLYSSFTGDLGFDHIIDVLKQDVAEGRIRPEQLSKVSMEQAVRRTYEYDQEMAKKMAETQAKVTEGMPVHKEYPEGYKWIELTKPKDELPEGFKILPDQTNYKNPGNELFTMFDDKGNAVSTGASETEALRLYKRQEREQQLADALKYEGDTMGHCVGGYCPDVIAGRSRIYSLRDAKGEPHVTIEVKPTQRSSGDVNAPRDAAEYQKWIHEEAPPRINQIKGKQNRAPKEEYLPFVQDFVRSGNWSDVGDLRNAGLRDIKKTPKIEEYLKKKGTDVPRYLTENEYQGHESDFLMDQLYPKDETPLPPEQGMAGGGSVGLKNALNNLLRTDKPEVHMSLGGDAAKAALKAAKVKHPLVFPRAAAKSLEDIRPIAQRIAEQMTGDFVRQHPNPKVSTNPASKSRKQFEREQNIPMETRNLVPPADVPVLDYEKKMGNILLGVPGDPTLGGVLEAGSLENVAKPTVELTRVGDVTPEHPVPLFGGPRYGNDERFWASNYSAAVPIQNRADKLSELYESPVLGQYIKMAPDSANFALHNLDALLAIQQPEKLSKAKMEKLNREIKAGSPKYGKFPGFVGFKDPIDVLLQSQLDSNLRKHIAETLTKPTITDELGLANGLDVVAAISYPELRNMEAGVSGFSIGELRPKSDLKMSLGEHPTYDTNIPGALIGQSKYPVPSEIAFPDTTAYARSRMTPGVQEFNMLKMLGPRERIDQQYIDEIKMYEELMKQYTGKKKGGLAQTKKVKRHGNTVPH